MLALAVTASAVLTALELAIFAPSEARVRTLAEEGFRGGEALAQLRAHSHRVLVLLRLADTMADMTAGVLAGYIAFLYWGVPGLAIAIGLAALAISVGAGWQPGSNALSILFDEPSHLELVRPQQESRSGARRCLPARIRSRSW